MPQKSIGKGAKAIILLLVVGAICLVASLASPILFVLYLAVGGEIPAPPALGAALVAAPFLVVAVGLLLIARGED
jgi:hypothetical protein